METINGTITSVSPEGGYQGQFGYVYTFQMTIQCPDGTYKTGQIGSKSQTYPLSNGQPISVETTLYQGATKFTKFDPKYAHPQATGAPPQGQQAAPAAAQGTNTPPPDPEPQSMRIVRGNALNAVMSATTVPSDMIKDYLLASVTWIMSGEWHLEPRMGNTNNPQAKERQPGEDEPNW